MFVRESVLGSNRAITAVFGHETFEIEALREAFQRNGGAIRATTYDQMVKPGPVNVHYGAVDFGDELVRDMIKRGY